MGNLKLEELEIEDTIIARRISSQIGLSAHDPSPEWKSAQPIRFSTDWRGQGPDPELETEVRILWSPSILYLRFTCHYRQLFVFGDSELNGRRDQLWERDVVEAFLQPADLAAKSVALDLTSRYRAFYKELEIAPNGMWIDLDISPSGLTDLKSDLTRSVHMDRAEKIWTAELAIPMNALTANFDPGTEWRANFFRVEGRVEPRRYMAWRPTHTPEPNFHVPKAFGILKFEP